MTDTNPDSIDFTEALKNKLQGQIDRVKARREAGLYEIARTFNLDVGQHTEILQWTSDHDCTLESHGAIGGAITYTFTPCNIGLIVKATCACGAVKDVSDYDDW